MRFVSIRVFLFFIPCSIFNIYSGMKKIIRLAFVVLVLLSCAEKKPVADPQVLEDADIAFSDFSVKHGFQKAFVEFAGDRVVLLKPNRMPIVGKQSLIKSYEGKSDSGVVLAWRPATAVIAESGELGYTYGFWTFVAQSDTSRGTYLTVWKKDSNGNWKFIADTGNEGLGK
jgi:ketosteroid isomerase-like protein